MLIRMTDSGKDDKDGREKFDELMNKMSDVKKKWKEEADSDEEDETGQLLDQAIELAIEQGRGWTPGEKEAYLERILDDEFVSYLQLPVPLTLPKGFSCCLSFTDPSNVRTNS